MLTERARDGTHLPELVEAVDEGLVIATVLIIASALAASRRRSVLGKLRQVSSQILPSLVVIRVLVEVAGKLCRVRVVVGVLVEVAGKLCRVLVVVGVLQSKTKSTSRVDTQTQTETETQPSQGCYCVF